MAGGGPVNQLGDLKARYPRDIAAVLLLKCFGVRVSSQGRNYLARRPCLLFFVVLATPGIISLAPRITDPLSGSPEARYSGWVGYFILVDLMCVAFEWAGCRAFYALTQDLDEMLTGRGRDAVHAWITRTTSPWRQAVVSAVGASVGLGGMMAVDSAPETQRVISVGVGSYLVVAVTGGCVFNCVYWLWECAYLPRSLARAGNMRLLWSSPARTPGIELLSRCYRWASLLAAVGTAVCIYPWISWSGEARGSSMLSVAKWTLLFISMAATLAISFTPQWFLSSAVSRARLVSVRRLRRGLPVHAPVSDSVMTEESARRLDALDGVIASPSGVIDGQTISSALLALAAAGIPPILQIILD